jgi:hypothetical protein
LFCFQDRTSIVQRKTSLRLQGGKQLLLELRTIIGVSIFLK